MIGRLLLMGGTEHRVQRTVATRVPDATGGCEARDPGAAASLVYVVNVN